MTDSDLRRALLAERYGDVVRCAHEAMAGATTWTPEQQEAHRRELVAATHDVPVDAETIDAVILGLPPRSREVA